MGDTLMTKYRTIDCIILLSALVTCTKFREAAAATPPAYTVTDLGTLGGTFSQARAINASGQVTGRSYTTGDTEVHTFLYDGALYDLGTLSGTNSNGWDINDSGQVTGWSYTTANAAESHAFLWTPTSSIGASGTLHDLGTLGGTYSEGYGINASSQVTGFSTTTGGAETHTFLYDGTMHDLGTLGGTYSSGSGVNASGQVSGTSSLTTGDIAEHAFLWTPTTPNGASGTMNDLGTLGGSYSFGRGINASGQVAGDSYTTGDAAEHAFLYDGTLHDLGTLGGTSSYGYGISSSGQVTGYSYTTGNSHAFLYTSGLGMVDLNTLIDPLSGWELIEASGINDAGQITGFGLIGGEGHAFLLTAVPEPSTIALVALGVVALAVRRIRRITSLPCLFCALSVTASAQAATYTVTDLGALGGTNSLGWGINASGQVTGYAATTDDAAIEPFLWTPTTPNGASGTIHDLGTLDGAFGWGIGINASGQVAGVSATAGHAAEHATLWIPTSPNGASVTRLDLETLGGTYSQGTGVNDSGQVTGYSDMTGDTTSRAFMWKPTTPGGANGTMHDLGSLGGSSGLGWDINASGQVAGYSDTTGDAAQHAFLWTPTMPNGVSGTMHDLGSLGGTNSDGSGINDSGQVVGSSQTTGDAAYHAYLWTPMTPGGASGTTLDLGTLGGLNSYGYRVIADGQVVGGSEVAAEVSNYSHAFLYTSGSGMVDLNTLIDPLSGWELLDADEINDAGQITGQGLIGEDYHAYLLTPVRALAGDYSGNGIVGPEDYNLWKASFGSIGIFAADGNDNHVVDAADYTMWRDHLGQSAGSGSLTNGTVPEPSTLLLLFAGTLAMCVRRRATVS
jgi:probable HAF family extracellular repeat protein